MDLTEAVVIGAGAMGPGIAACFALAGVRTTIVSRSANGAMRGVFLAQGLAEQLADNGLVTKEAPWGGLNSLFQLHGRTLCAVLHPSGPLTELCRP